MSALATLEELSSLRATVAELRESMARMQAENERLRAEIQRSAGHTCVVLGACDGSCLGASK